MKLVINYYKLKNRSQKYYFVKDFISIYMIVLGYDKQVSDKNTMRTYQAQLESLVKKGLVFSSMIGLSILRTKFLPI